LGPKDIVVIILGGAIVGISSWMLLVGVYISVTGTEFWGLTPLEAIVATTVGAWSLSKNYTGHK